MGFNQGLQTNEQLKIKIHEYGNYKLLHGNQI
jgi:hypothetical protein